MAYLVGKTSIDIISDDAVDIRENLPVGFYFKLESAPMRGFSIIHTKSSFSEDIYNFILKEKFFFVGCVF